MPNAPELDFSLHGPIFRNVLRHFPRRLRLQLDVMQNTLHADDVLLNLTCRAHEPVLRRLHQPYALYKYNPR